jgi:hypothetical protein
MQNDTIKKNLDAALAPTRAAIVERVKETTIARVAAVYAKFEANEWDMSKAFPINYNSRSCKADKEAAAFASDYTRIPDGWKTSMMPREPKPRLALSEKQIAAKAEKRGERHADELLESYAHKLTAKVVKFAEGREIAAVSYSGGSDPWGYSFVKVDLANGETFTLRTQVIVNCSVLGTLFNQFPTRLV